jgi:hypothetical protein
MNERVPRFTDWLHEELLTAIRRAAETAATDAANDYSNLKTLLTASKHRAHNWLSSAFGISGKSSVMKTTEACHYCSGGCPQGQHLLQRLLIQVPRMPKDIWVREWPRRVPVL